MLRIASSVALGLAVTIGSSTAWAQTKYPKGTSIWEPGAYNGYTLFVGGDGIVYLIDMDGSVVNRWLSPVPGEELNSVEPLPDGCILAYSHQNGANRRMVGELNYDGETVWSYAMPSGAPLGADFHHDSVRLANGNTLVLAAQPIRVPSISPNQLSDDCILELDPDGKVVWSWFTWQHFAEFNFDEDARELIAEKGGDWAHANSISVIPPNSHTLPALAPGNIIVSQRATNCVFIIEKSTGAIVWRIGPENHLTFGQHDAHMIEQGLVGAGNILVFDNGSGTGYPLRRQAPGISRVHEIDPVTKTITWTYDATMSGLSRYSFFSNLVSGAQRLPNGNTLICSGANGRLFEVNSDGDILWEYMSPYKGYEWRNGSERLVVFRAYRLPYNWVPKANRRPRSAAVLPPWRNGSPTER